VAEQMSTRWTFPAARLPAALASASHVYAPLFVWPQ
jgi:hypothetical protein